MWVCLCKYCLVRLWVCVLSTSHCHFGINKCLALLLSPVLTLFSAGPLHEHQQPNLPTLAATVTSYMEIIRLDSIIYPRLEMDYGRLQCMFVFSHKRAKYSYSMDWWGFSASHSAQRWCCSVGVLTETHIWKRYWHLKYFRLQETAVLGWPCDPLHSVPDDF